MLSGAVHPSMDALPKPRVETLRMPLAAKGAA
jgi:hypothetical protein